MVKTKLTKQNREQIAKLIEEGHQIKDLAKKYDVNRSRYSCNFVTFADLTRIISRFQPY